MSTTPDKYLILDTRGERRQIATGITTDGPTTSIPANQDPLRDMMCMIMCACKKLFEDNKKVPAVLTDSEQPGPDAAAAAPETEESATAEPRKLQQNCVATFFQLLDEAAEYKSPVKAEVSYDMDGYRSGFVGLSNRYSRPQPLMSKSKPGMPLRWHWGVMSHVGRRKKEGWSFPLFERGGKSLRRPDIVVLRAPGMWPDEPYIAMIFEMKFDEKPEEQQIRAYRRIVGGDRNRVKVIEVKDCGCENRKERLREVTREELVAWAAAMTAALGAAAGNNDRRPPGLNPAHAQTAFEVLGAIVGGAIVVAALPAEVIGALALFVAWALGVNRLATQ
ncbi:hypothetical protein BH11PSE9_BH11PSE9_22220 [soil metagenome]